MFKNIVCEICSSEIIKQVSAFVFKSKLLGDITIPAVEQYLCSGCGKALMPLAEGGKIREFVQKKEQKAIAAQPVGDFVSLNEAAAILEITKQAFSKNPRIKKGLICSTVIDGKTLYLKKSVEEFKRSGKDGRIILNANHAVVVTKEVTKSVGVYFINVFASSDYVLSKTAFPQENKYVDCDEFDKQYQKYCAGSSQRT